MPALFTCLVVEVRIDDFGLWVGSIFEIVRLESRVTVPLEECVEGLLKNVMRLETRHL